MHYDLIVVGSGAAGMMAAIRAADLGRRVLLLEKLPQLGAKLKATGGGRCNLTNTLDNETFMSRFGREGRFMGSALEALDAHALRAFFERIGVPSHAPDGFQGLSAYAQFTNDHQCAYRRDAQSRCGGAMPAESGVASF